MPLQIILPEEITDMDKLVLRLTEELLSKFGGVIVRAERIDGWDGSNVRIVVKNIDLLEEIIREIGEFESKLGIVGTIIPEIVSEDEYKILFK